MVSFFLSARELEVARQVRDGYEIHFWGAMDLGRPMPAEYDTLTALGFPRIIRDPADATDRGELLLTASSYRARLV